MLVTPLKPARLPRPVTYPDTDGRPLAETQVHLDQIMYLLAVLGHFFAAAPDVFVAADLLLYYVEGDPKRRVAPDVFVARGVRNAKAKRRSYLLWDEGVPPHVVFEVTSKGTRREDTREKRSLYQHLAVREYFLFDPLAEYLRPPLQGFRLVSGGYEPLAPQPDGSLHSDALGLELRQRDGNLCLWDPAAGRWLRTYEEAERGAARAEAEAARAEREASRAESLAAEVARLRALLDGGPR